jgi:hypothetical protein
MGDSLEDETIRFNASIQLEVTVIIVFALRLLVQRQ